MSGRVTAEDIEEFERRFAIPFDAQKRTVQGLDLVQTKKREAIELMYALRMCDSRHGLFLVGKQGTGRTFVLEKIIEEVENFQKIGTPLTKDQEYWPHIEDLGVNLPLGFPQKIGVYDFRNHKLMELNFQDPAAGLSFTEDVMTFFDVLLERWTFKLPEISRSARYFQAAAKEGFHAKVGEVYNGVKFKLVSEGEGRFDCELDETYNGMKEMRRTAPDELTAIVAEFRKEKFARLYDSYKREILPEALSHKSRKAKEAMMRKLREEENKVRSRLSLPRLTRGDDKLLEPHLSLYPTSDELLIKLYGEILKSKYESHPQVGQWINSMVGFLSQRSIRKILEHPEDLTVHAGGKDVFLDDMLRASVYSFEGGKGSERILEKILDPTGDNLFGSISSDHYIAPQHCVQLGAFGKRRIVVVSNIKKLCGDESMSSTLANILENGSYELNAGGMTLRVQSPAIVTLAGSADELEGYPSIMQRLRPIMFPEKYTVSTMVLESFADMVHNNKRKGGRPFAKSGIEMLTRVLRADTGYLSLMSAKFGLAARDAADISFRVGEDGYVKDVDVVKYFESQRKGFEQGYSMQRRFARNTGYHLIENKDGKGSMRKIIGQALWLAVDPPISGMFYSELGETSVVNVSISPGKGRMFSTGKGDLEGSWLEKYNMNVFSYMAKIAEHTNFDLTLNFVVQDETDGASASGVSAVACLSALSGIPIDQRMAMTGELLDFEGKLVPIGAVTEKTYWYYMATKILSDMYKVPYEGFGVVIPRLNLEQFHMDRPVFSDMEQDIKNGSFAICPVDSIAEAIPIMMCKETENGEYLPATADEVFQRSRVNAKEMSDRSKEIFG